MIRYDNRKNSLSTKDNIQNQRVTRVYQKLQWNPFLYIKNQGKRSQ